MAVLLLDSGNPWEQSRVRDLANMESQFVPHSTIKISPESFAMNGAPMIISEYCPDCNIEHDFRLSKAVRGSGIAYYSSSSCSHTLSRKNENKIS